MDLPQAIQLWLARFLEPLVAAAQDRSYRRQLLTALGVDLAAEVEELLDQLEEPLKNASVVLNDLIGRDLSKLSLSDIEPMLKDVRTVTEVVQIFVTTAAQFDSTVFEPKRLGKQLISLLTIRSMLAYAPMMFELALLLRLIQLRDDGNLPTLVLEQIGPLTSNPSKLLSEYYFGTEGLRSLKTPEDADHAADRLFPRLAALLHALGVSTRYIRDLDLQLPDNPGVADRMMMIQLPLDVGAGAGVVLTLQSALEGGESAIIVPYGTLAFAIVGGEWEITLDVRGATRGVSIEPGGTRLADGTVDSTLSVTLGASRSNNAGISTFRSSNSGTRIEIGRLQFHAETSFGATSSASIEIEASSAAITIAAGDGDGFLQKMLPNDGVRIDFNLGVGWASKKGLYFRGGAGLEMTLQINKDLFGILRIVSIYLVLQAKNSAINIIAAMTITLKLGPIIATVEQIGLEATLSFPQSGGNLGVANLALGFKPPNGAGLLIDAGVVVGGGSLLFDRANEQYAGSIQLEFAGKFALSAVGLLTTRMPDGSKGFSLLIIISVEGFPPIQLGFGFTLNGVGGLLGINRTAMTDVLRAGLKTGSLGSVLFPHDVVANAPRIISDLRAIFPPSEGQFLVGPAAIIGFGVPTLLSLEIGLVFEFPSPFRLLILGRLRATLPEPETAVVYLQMDAIGEINFTKGEVSLDATLYESRISKFTLTGDMALRASWGPVPNFVLAVGGFHPRFKPPSGLRKLDRIALTLAESDNPRLRLEAYFALTSNTAQFGARLDLFYSAGSLSVEGMLAFDAIIHFAPFQLEADFGASVVLRVDKVPLMSVSLDVHLSGPTPWRVRGTATFEILLVSTSFDFDVRFGPDEMPSLPEPIDVLAQLTEAIKDPRNWASTLPARDNPLVTLRKVPEAEDKVVAHPLATLGVHQRIVPLDLEIAKFGNAMPAGERRFSISFAGLNDKTQPIKDFFAPAQFLALSDDAQLRRPSFEQFSAGVQLDDDMLDYGPPLTVPIEFEEPHVVSISSGIPDIPKTNGVLNTLTAPELDAQIALGAAARAPIRASGYELYAIPTRKTLSVEPSFVVAATADLTVTPIPTFSDQGVSLTAAVDALNSFLREHPEQREHLQVVARYEAVRDKT